MHASHITSISRRLVIASAAAALLITVAVFVLLSTAGDGSTASGRCSALRAQALASAQAYVAPMRLSADQAQQQVAQMAQATLNANAAQAGLSCS